MVNKINEYDTEYIIPYGQTEVSEDEFSHCHDLEKLYVPAYVTNSSIEKLSSTKSSRN